jgi:hypothetical protein
VKHRFAKDFRVGDDIGDRHGFAHRRQFASAAWRALSLMRELPPMAIPARFAMAILDGFSD